MDWCINASYSGIYVVSILRDKRGGKEMCKGYATAQEAYDRQLPPDYSNMWHCASCDAPLYADSRVYIDKTGAMMGCEFCTEDKPAEFHFEGERY